MITRPTDETPEALDELASEYVLGTLSAEQRAEVQQRLRSDVGLRSAIDSWERRLLGLTELAEPLTPSAHLWQRIERSVNALYRQPSTSRAMPPATWWNRLPLWRGLAGAGLAATLLLGAMLLTQTTVKPTYLVVLVAPQDKAPEIGRASCRERVL